MDFYELTLVQWLTYFSMQECLLILPRDSSFIIEIFFERLPNLLCIIPMPSSYSFKCFKNPLIRMLTVNYFLRCVSIP